MGAKVSLAFQLDLECTCSVCRAGLLIQVAKAIEEQLVPGAASGGNLCLTAAALSSTDRETFDACADTAFYFIDLMARAAASGSVH